MFFSHIISTHNSSVTGTHHLKLNELIRCTHSADILSLFASLKTRFFLSLNIITMKHYQKHPKRIPTYSSSLSSFADCRWICCLFRISVPSVYWLKAFLRHLTQRDQPPHWWFVWERCYGKVFVPIEDNDNKVTCVFVGWHVDAVT